LEIVIGVVIGSFQFVANSLICPPRAVGVALCDTAIRPFVRLSVPALGAQLPYAIGTLAACSSAVRGVRTRPRTDVDPPRVELPSAGTYRLL